MKVLGISGSPRKEDTSGTYKLVKTVLENTGCEYEIVSLRGKQISGCIDCLGCAKDNVCKVKDDFEPLREKLVEADAFVIGGPNYYDTLNSRTLAFLERWFQFHHQGSGIMWGKLAVAVGVGSTKGNAPADQIEKMLFANRIETIAKVTGQGALHCYSCGYGETCPVGMPVAMHGEGVKITEDMIPNVCKQKDLMDSAIRAGQQLGERLESHDPAAVALAMQEKMNAKIVEIFGESVN